MGLEANQAVRTVLSIWLLLAGLEARAVVPPFSEVLIRWDAVSATNQILGYRVYIIDGVTGVTNYAGFTVSNRFTLTNITATPQRWFVTTTNPGNESVPCFMSPFKPESPSNLTPTTSVFKVTPPVSFERSTDLVNWHERFRLFKPDSNGVQIVMQTVTPDMPFAFYRLRPNPTPASPPMP